ncbi:hypothetical protein NQ317_011196 [Molorchus minor]|uniref:EF-hand domain-containing protein n=1 Tax=Molorchus minor TaxID=1323400 RepID=A0ABQ9JRM8_9CUCU|nr:hypothetical protein NQ317_011196 [Molorchus minor]
MSHFSSPMPSREFLWDVFQRVDRDRSGFINVDELASALSNGTWSPFNPETVRLMIGFDRHNRGQVSFEDFVPYGSMSQTGRIGQNSNIDKTRTENGPYFIRYRLSDGLLDTLMRKFDRHGKGTILFDDFIQCCIVLYTLTAAFKEYDTDQDGFCTIHYDQFLSMAMSLKI